MSKQEPWYDFSGPAVTKVIISEHGELSDQRKIHMLSVLAIWGSYTMWYKHGMQPTRGVRMLSLVKERFHITGNKHTVLKLLEDYIENDLGHTLERRLSERDD